MPYARVEQHQGAAVKKRRLNTFNQKYHCQQSPSVFYGTSLLIDRSEEAAITTSNDVVTQLRSPVKDVLETGYMHDALSPASRYSINRRYHQHS
jgi:hypothetical protein